MLENERNEASHLMRDIDAQWNDDGHHAFHVLLTGEHRGYYLDYAQAGAAGLARVMAEGFFFQGQHSSHRGRPRGTPSRDLPMTAFVLFLQNHDQIGNRAFGERLTQLVGSGRAGSRDRRADAVPANSHAVHGRGNRVAHAVLFFTDHTPELGQAVREGRRKEFAHFPEFSDPAKREQFPIRTRLPRSRRRMPRPDPAHAEARRALYQRLIAIRMDEIVPHLDHTRSLDAQPLGSAAVVARWRLGEHGVLTLAVNLGAVPVPIVPPAGRLLFGSPEAAGGRAEAGELPGTPRWRSWTEADERRRCAAHARAARGYRP